MYERILTGPVVREEVSRRGRRPKSGIAKATAAAAAATATSISGNPLLANGLLPGVDLTTLQALQQNLQNLQNLKKKHVAATQPCRRRKAAGWRAFHDQKKFWLFCRFCDEKK